MLVAILKGVLLQISINSINSIVESTVTFDILSGRDCGMSFNVDIRLFCLLSVANLLVTMTFESLILECELPKLFLGTLLSRLGIPFKMLIVEFGLSS